jgi:hypothetical protein
MSVSYLETVRAALRAKLKTIIAGATFRNTVAEVYEDFQGTYGSYPSIVLKFGTAKLRPTDSAWKLYDVYIDFGIFCEIACDTGLAATSTLVAAQDSLVHDVFRCVADLYTENIAASSGARWNVEKTPDVQVTPIFPTGENTGEFLIMGTLKIRNLDKSFDD